MSRRDALYFAFPDGALEYDCAPCGRCCRGLGYADTTAHLAQVTELGRLHAFAAGAELGPLAGFYTYADGCRLLASDNCCDLHRLHGPTSKPLICRLFPFSRLLELDGLWAVLPQPSCPWRAWTGTAAVTATHSDLASLLDDSLLDGLSPTPRASVTRLPAATRVALESRLRDKLTAGSTMAQVTLQSAAAYAEDGLSMTPVPELELWLDLLRCPGEPPPMPPATEHLLVACVPTLRILLCEALPLAAIPGALAGFELWLRALGELGDSTQRLTGEDLLHLFAAARPLLVVLALAEVPLPGEAILRELMAGRLMELWPSLPHYAGVPLGEAMLRHLRGAQTPMQCLTEIGEHLSRPLVELSPSG